MDIDEFQGGEDSDGVVLYYEGTALDISGEQGWEQIKTSLGEKEVLLKEVHHRVKNNLQIMSACLICRPSILMTRRRAETFRTSMDRIKSMALIHDKLYRSESLSSIYFPGYVSDLVRSSWGRILWVEG